MDEYPEFMKMPEEPKQENELPPIGQKEETVLPETAAPTGSIPSENFAPSYAEQASGFSPAQPQMFTNTPPMQEPNPLRRPMQESYQPPHGSYAGYGGAYSGAPVYWTQTTAAPYRPAEPKREQPAKKKKGSIHIGTAIALMLCCALIGGVMGVAGAFFGNFLQKNAKPSTAVSNTNQTLIYEGNREIAEIETVRVDTGELLSAAEVYAQNVNSTVGITTSITTNYWGYQTTSAASGSGFILTADGYILTNFHVIEASNSITVTMYDGTAYDAQLIGYDESNDIAVLKIDAEGLIPVVLGSSSDMNVGDPVVAIGNPLGELTFSLTQGAISAIEREVTMSNGVSMNLMQTDCAINSGNSGGALFNLYGEVIGITNAKYSSSGYSSQASIDNIGFAIPIDSVRSIVESLIEKGYISKPYIGVSVTDVSTEAQNYGLPKGASILGVVEDSPAEKAGLQKNDIITEVNGTTIESRTDLSKLIGNCAVGDVLKLKVYRQGEVLTLTVTVGEQIQSGLDSNTEEQQTNQGYGYFPWG